MAKFGIDSNMIFDKDDKSVATRLSDHDTSLDGLSSSLAESATDKINAISKGLKTSGLNSDASANITAINNALTTYKEVYIPAGTFYISLSIIIPDGKRLIMSKKCVIKPTSDFDVIVFGDQIYMENGIVDVSELSTFTSSTLINAVKSSGSTSYSIINGFTAKRGSTYARSGNGITLRGTASYNGVVAFCRFEQFFLQYFDNAINIDVSGIYWANTNYFSGTSSVCNSAVNNNNGGGNTFNIFGQAGTSTIKPSVYSNGLANTFSGYIYDVGNAGNNQIYYQVDGNGNNIIGNIPSKFIQELSGGRNNILQNLIHHPPTLGVNDYMGATETYFTGDQSNFLVSADKRFTISEVFTNTANFSSASYAFRVNGSSSLGYHFNNTASTTDNAQLTINLGSAYNIRLFGLTMASNQWSKHIKFEVFSTNDNSWHGNDIYPTNSGMVLWDIASSLSYSIVSTITQLRITVYQPVGSNGTVNINSIFAHSTFGGNAFIPTHGGLLYGDLDLNKNKMKNFVLESGATASRPTSPLVGQVFYDTTLGKPIYCKVGGASPTWTDSTGTTV